MLHRFGRLRDPDIARKKARTPALNGGKSNKLLPERSWPEHSPILGLLVGPGPLSWVEMKKGGLKTGGISVSLTY